MVKFRIIATRLLVIAVLSTLALAQSGAAQQTNKMAIVTANVPLTPEQAAVFWPLYNDYQVALLEVQDRMALLLRDYAANHAALSDKRSKELFEEYLSIEKERLKLIDTHSKAFLKELPVKVVVRYFQVENRLETMTEYGIINELPLLELSGQY